MTPPHDRYRSIRNILWAVLALNLAVALAKLVYGIISHSAAMEADGFHSLFDGASNVIGLVGMWFAARPADDDHPYGHGKYETFAAALIGILLIFAGFTVGRGALDSLFGRGVPTEVTTISFAIMLSTLAVNILVTTWERRAGKRLGSEVLVADASHTLSDVLVSVGVIVSLVVVRLGWEQADGIVALIVAAVILRTAWGILRGVLHTLGDAARLPADEVAAVAGGVPDVVGCHAVRSEGSDSHVYVDLHVQVASGHDSRARSRDRARGRELAPPRLRPDHRRRRPCGARGLALGRLDQRPLSQEASPGRSRARRGQGRRARELPGDAGSRKPHWLCPRARLEDRQAGYARSRAVASPQRRPGVESQIEIVEFSDPYCTWCWGSEPVLRHALEAYGDRLRVRFVMGGLVEDRATFYDPANGIGGEQWERQIAAHWVEASGRHGMPVDMAHYERVLGMPSTFPANIAYEAAKLQDPALADRYLRRLREAAAIEGLAIHEPEVLADLAAEMGLDRERFTSDFAGPAVDAFAADREVCATYRVHGFPAFLVRVGEREQVLSG